MQEPQASDSATGQSPLCVALELTPVYWKLALQDGRRLKAATAAVRASQPNVRLDQALAFIEATKREWKCPADTPVVAAYALGDDGYWIARALRERGIDVKVVDADSLPLQGRKGGTGAVRLLDSLRAWLGGQRDVMRVVEVPTREESMRTMFEEERENAESDIALSLDYLREMLSEVGCTEEIGEDFAQRLAQGEVVDDDGEPLSADLQWLLQTECERLDLIRKHLQRVEKALSQ